MEDWLRKFGKSPRRAQEEPEDFILLRQDVAASGETEQSAPEAEQPAPEAAAEAWNNTADITMQVPIPENLSMDDTGELAPLYSGTEEDTDNFYAEYEPKHTDPQAGLVERISYDLEQGTPASVSLREPGFRGFLKTYKSWFIGSGIGLGCAVVIVALYFLLVTLSNPLRGYSQAEVVKGNVTLSMDAAGTLEANARYAITSLVPGKVTASKPEVGDKVTTNTVLYQLDDSEAKLAVERAQNQISRSKALGSSAGSDTDRIHATEGGTIHTLNIRVGSTVSYGQVVATIKRADDSVIAVTSPLAGTVASVSVSQGGSVSVGGTIATITGTHVLSGQRTSSYDQKSGELDLQSAQKQLEHYTIKSPVNGVVIEKNTRAGDNVGVANLDNPMMVILDTNSVKFTFQVDAYTLRDLEPGMTAIVSTESMGAKTFSGKVSRLGSEGTENEEGKVMFDVDVTVDDPDGLLPGMKVTARVILASATNVMYIPQQALMEADGKNAVVLVRDNPSGDMQVNLDNSDTVSTELSYPWIKVPKGCKLVTVKYGVADGTNVEIISGLAVGDTVVFDPNRAPEDLSPEPTATPTPAVPSTSAAPRSSALPRASAGTAASADPNASASPSASASPNASASAAPSASAKPQSTALNQI